MRSMVRLLHLADVHLGATYAPFGAVAASRRTEVAARFRELPERAREWEVDLVLVAGDLFDGASPDPADRAAAEDVFRRLDEDGRPVLIVPGNHDSHLFAPNPWTDPPGGARVLLSPTLDRPVSVETAGGPVHVYGLAFDPAREAAPLATLRRVEKDGFHVALLHASVMDSPRWAADGTALRVLPEELARLPVDYIALGDHHRHRPPEAFADAPACYPGSFAAVDLTETGPRGVVTADLSRNEPVRVRHRPLDVTAVFDLGELDVSSFEDENALVAALVATAPPRGFPIATLTGTSAFPLDVERIESSLGERFGQARLRDASRYYSHRRLDELAAEDTVAGHLVRLARARVEGATEPRERRVADRALRIALRELGADS